VTDSSKLGAKIGPRIAGLFSQAYLSTLGQTAGHKAQVSQFVTQGVLRSLASEGAPFVPPWLATAANSGELDPETRAFLQQFLGTPDYVKVATILSGVFGVMGLAGGMGANLFAPALQESFAYKPNHPLDPSAAAAMVAHNWMSLGDGRAEAARSALSESRFAHLVNMAVQWPGLAELQQLTNRGFINDLEAKNALQHAGVTADMANVLVLLREQLLPPALLADAVLRGWMNQDDGAAEAALQGLSPGRFQIMVDETGEPPGLMQLLEAYRRHIIDKPRLEHGIRESRVRNEWIDVVEALRHAPPSPAEAIEGAVKGHLSMDVAKAKAEIGGLDPAEFDWMYHTTGNPPGAMEMLSLLNRGEVNEARVVESLKQGHLANDYIPDVLKLKRRLIPEGVLMLVQQSGALSRSETISRLEDLGYNAADSATMATTGSRAKLAADWTAGKTIVTDQYQLGLISRKTGLDYLQTIGYDEHEAASIMEIAELARTVAAQRSAVSKVQTLYVSYHMSATTARTSLTALGVPADQLDHIMELWTIEREAAAKVLTPAQVLDAYEYKIIDQGEAQTQLEQLGYPPLQAWMLLSIKAKGPLQGKPGG
jgi:hypothetical protein